jgi:hypothetical protein
MKRERLDGLIFLLFGSVIFILVSIAMERSATATVIDFKAVYYGARCLLQHADPYRESEMLRVYRAEGGDRMSDAAPVRRLVAVYINLPTGLILIAPLALLPWAWAHALWIALIALSIVLGACLMWNLAADHAPIMAGVLICFFLLTSIMLTDVANTAGVVVGLCAVAVWCFLKGRFVPAGILCFAVSLAIKPHVAGLIWLYFLLAGGLCRKRALQTLVVTIVLGLPGVLWVSYVAPHWMSELHSNLTATSARSDINDPGPTSASRDTPDSIVDLQTVISVFLDDPRIYNPASYLFCVPLLLVWVLATLRSRFSPATACLALAAIAPLAMLPLYHRQDDARLLLLTIPACAMLWAERGVVGWSALAVTAAGLVVNGDTLTAARIWLSRPLLATAQGLTGEILTVVLARPVPLVLLAMCIFYLWAYVRHTRVQVTFAGPEVPGEAAVGAPAASSVP